MTSRLIAFLGQDAALLHERREIGCPAFSQLRRNLRIIVKSLLETADQEASEIAQVMNDCLRLWLTTPVEFRTSISSALKKFGDADRFDARWGLDGMFRVAVRSGEQLGLESSLMRVELSRLVDSLQSDNKKFRIFCHRRAREHFDTLFLLNGSSRLQDQHFLHSARGYQEMDLFDILIKVGPLRAQGWGAIPDAVKSAPKFQKLIQLVWSGNADEPNFGYDPVSPLGATVAKEPDYVLGNQIAWELIEIKSGDFTSVLENDGATEDELQKSNQPLSRRRAVLITLPNKRGILYPATEALSLDPNAGDEEAIGFRVPGETLLPSMFLIQTEIGEVDFGHMEVAEGGYCSVWKERLRERLRVDRSEFCRLLQEKGVDLINLHACVDYWAQPRGVAIHAPGNINHFRILIEELGFPARKGHGREVSWWRSAWDETRRAIGKAIQIGRQENELINEQALHILKKALLHIRQAASSEEFTLPIPLGADLHGTFYFLRITDTEDGFLAPETEVGIVRSVDRFEQWRVC
jgi:hypothetical protein